MRFNEGDTIIMLNQRRILNNDKSLNELKINDKNDIIEFNICSKNTTFDDIKNKMMFGNDYEDEASQLDEQNNLEITRRMIRGT